VLAAQDGPTGGTRSLKASAAVERRMVQECWLWIPSGNRSPLAAFPQGVGGLAILFYVFFLLSLFL
jgi:hypothetical protein